MNEIKEKGLNAFFWDFSGLLANHGTTLIISIFLARILDPKDFGLLGMVTIFISMAQSLTYFGFGESLIQKKESTQEQISTMFYINVAAGIVLAAALFFSAPLIAWKFEEPQLIDMCRVLSVCFVLLSFNLIQNALLAKELNFKAITKSNIYSSILSGIIGIVLAFNGFGIWSLVIKTILNFFFTTIFIWYFSKWVPKPVFKLSSIKDHWNYGYKMYLSSIMHTIFGQLDSFFIGDFMGATQLGFYYRAKSLNQLLVKYSSESLTKVLLPVFSQVQDDRAKVVEIAQKTLHASSFVTFGIMGLLYVEGDNLIVLLFGKSWLFSVEYFRIMIFYAYAFPVSAVLGNIIQGLGNSGRFLTLEFIKKMLTLIALGVGIYGGVSAFLWSTVVISFIGVLFSLFYVEKQIEVSMFVFLKILMLYFVLSALGTAFFVYFEQYFELRRIHSFLLFSPLFLLFYVGINAMLRTEGYLIIKGVTQNLVGKLKRTKHEAV